MVQNNKTEKLVEQNTRMITGNDDRILYLTWLRRRGTKFIKVELSVDFGSCVQGQVIP